MEASALELGGPSSSSPKLRGSKGGLTPDSIKRNKDRGKGSAEELATLLKEISAQAGKLQC